MENNVNPQPKKDKFPTWAIVLIVLVALGFFTLPLIGVVAALVIPTLVADTDTVKNRTVFKKTVSTLNQAILMSQAIDDKEYSNPDELWKMALKKQLQITKDNGNTITLADGTEVKYEKLRSNCIHKWKNDPVNETTACAILIIDANGFEKVPNKFTVDSKKVNDQFKLLVYKNAVEPADGSIEDIVLHSNK